jgi:hypothetical protein
MKGKNSYRILVGKLVHERALARSEQRLHDNIKLDFKKVMFGPSVKPLLFVQVMLSAKRLSAGGAGALRSKVLSGNMDRSIQAYHNMNRFLAAFLEHVNILSLVIIIVNMVKV